MEKFLVGWKKIKLHNRRVMLGHAKDDVKPYEHGHWVRFKILDMRMPKGERVVITEFRLTDEALNAFMALCINEYSP